MRRRSSRSTTRPPPSWRCARRGCLPSSAETATVEGVSRRALRHDLPITGMTCAGCVTAVERAIAATPGVTRAVVNLATQKATVVLDPEIATLDDLAASVARAGYGVVLPQPGEADAEERARRAERDDVRRRFLLALCAGAPVVALGMTHGALSFPGERWVQMALTAVTVLVAGGSYFRRAWSALRHGTADMNTLVALGTGAAFSYSAVATGAPSLVASGHAHPPVYFEAAAGIVVL